VNSILLCQRSELRHTGSKGCSVQTPQGILDVFVVAVDNGSVYAYRNSCPHTGGPLDWQPDQFLNIDRDHIQCATHDALFRMQDGYCVAGPCRGQYLAPVSVEVKGDEVFLLLMSRIDA
jgi:nitrite reductase/ring-hydroxylating ferredoxin subunit